MFGISTACSVRLTISFKWPDNYDFAATRAINEKFSATIHPNDVDGERIDEKKSDEKRSDENVQEVSVSEPRSDLEDELDPVALEKAFKFASWSSVALVSKSLIEGGALLIPKIAPRLDHPDSDTAFLCSDSLRRCRIHHMGYREHRVDILVCNDCGALSAV
jgi:hypothetical protein